MNSATRPDLSPRAPSGQGGPSGEREHRAAARPRPPSIFDGEDEGPTLAKPDDDDEGPTIAQPDGEAPTQEGPTAVQHRAPAPPVVNPANEGTDLMAIPDMGPAEGPPSAPQAPDTLDPVVIIGVPLMVDEPTGPAGETKRIRPGEGPIGSALPFRSSRQPAPAQMAAAPEPVPAPAIDEPEAYTQELRRRPATGPALPFVARGGAQSSDGSGAQAGSGPGWGQTEPVADSRWQAPPEGVFDASSLPSAQLADRAASPAVVAPARASSSWTRVVPLVLLAAALAVGAIVTALVVLSGCYTPGSGSGSGGSGGSSVCDNTDDCNNCRSCALSGECAQLYSDCRTSAACAGLDDCLGICGADLGCQQQCYTGNPNGVSLYNATADCLYCTACRSDCAGFRSCD